MEKVSFDYSTKNIPTATRANYTRRLIEKTELFLKRMRWKAFFHLNPNITGKSLDSFGFNSRLSPPSVPELKPFEESLLNLTQNIEFQTTPSQFQKQIKTDIKSIKDSNKLYVKADKTSNYYRMDQTKYQQLLVNNVTKTYKIADNKLENNINSEAKKIANKLDLDDRIETMAKREAFITLKDHKPNFENNPSCRLINPAKSEIGHISRQILGRINNNIISSNNTNLWRNTNSVLTWFQNIPDKQSTNFICFDVVEFYPSITEKTLNAALDFASQYDPITQEERNIILHAKKSLLFHNDQTWSKKSSLSSFDVTMGSFDGAETCELVGCFLLSKLQALLGNKIGLYRDDGLAALNQSARGIEQTKKQICKIFKQFDLKVTIEANKKIVDFLDVTLNLNDGSYRPYNKPNNTPSYVHSKSNHPPNILKNIPESINKRLSEISSNEKIFNEAIPTYQAALDKSGYNFKLKYSPTKEKPQKKRQRTRQVTWFNPPFDLTVKTDIGHQFLTILKKSFPKTNPLSKIFNTNTVKLSYSCMPNVKTIIDNNNKRLNKPTQKDAKTCNCRDAQSCPLGGNCLAKGIVYQATVISGNDKETYIGLTETEFKTRYRNHKTSFNYSNKRNTTELSKHIWMLKDENKDYTLEWAILSHARPYSNSCKRCPLCIEEKYLIITQAGKASLNRRSEFVGTCRHRNKFTLRNLKTKR